MKTKWAVNWFQNLLILVLGNRGNLKVEEMHAREQCGNKTTAFWKKLGFWVQNLRWVAVAESEEIVEVSGSGVGFDMIDLKYTDVLSAVWLISTASVCLDQIKLNSTSFYFFFWGGISQVTFHLFIFASLPNAMF